MRESTRRQQEAVRRQQEFIGGIVAERDRLRAENVKWLTALQEIDTMHGDGDAAFGRCLHIAREALAKPAA